MTRKEFLASALGAAALPLRGAAAKPRNIVFILVDDQRFDFLGCAGHPWLRTPHADRLAREGARFQNCFVTTSLCSPSRASILTGQYAHSHGVINNFDQLRPGCRTFGEHLERAGYQTAFIGKWHMGDPNLEGNPLATDSSDMPQPGWQRWVSFRGQGVYRNPVLNFDGARRKVNGYITDILTEEALSFLRRTDTSRPFCLYLSHKAVHAGFEPPARYAHSYPDDPVPMPRTAANTAENYRGKPEWLRRKRDSRHGLNDLYAGHETLDHMYRQTARTLAAVDESTGAVYDELARRGVLDDTLIVYTSDNGFLMGEHGLVDKRVMYEPSIRVPLLARCPSLFEAGQVLDELVVNLDFCPTFLEAAGVAIPETVQGRSLLPLLNGNHSNWRDAFLYEYFWDYEALHTPTVLGLRTRTHSYMSYQGIWDIDELYDISTDPDQTRNLLGNVRITDQPGGLVRNIPDPALRDQVKQFRRRMSDILAATNGRFYPSWHLCRTPD